ncbi:hypothetical protein H0H87_008617 [Tephrocybe sp. NHM501043]|nr:hypothetical protein H0H87_008617 [Tephrocybe sp. NHM501043]
MALSDDTRELISRVLEGLPVLTAKDIPDDEDSCPICLTPFSSLFRDDADGEAGITKLVACNHIFCRKDLTQWIQSMHGNCPTCRHAFLDIRPPSDSDDESSDGGEYIPGEDFIDEDDDGFMDTDGFSDGFGYTTDEMTDAQDWEGDTDMEGVELDGVDNESEWGLTDGESSMGSEDVDAAFMNEALEDGDDQAGGTTQVGVTLAGQQLSSDDLLNEPDQEK